MYTNTILQNTHCIIVIPNGSSHILKSSSYHIFQLSNILSPIASCSLSLSLLSLSLISQEPEVATDRYQGRQQSEEDSSTTGERLLDKEEEFNDLDQLDPPPPSTEVNEMALNNADLD